jgi:hypothetical protein
LAIAPDDGHADRLDIGGTTSPLMPALFKWQASAADTPGPTRDYSAVRLTLPTSQLPPMVNGQPDLGRTIRSEQPNVELAFNQPEGTDAAESRRAAIEPL